MTGNKFLSLCAVILSATTLAHATTTVTFAGDPNAATSNFGAPGTTATYGYTLTTSDSGTSFIVTVTSAGAVPQNVTFANIYVDSTGAVVPSGSDIGFSWNATGNFGFIPGGASHIDFTGTGITSSFTQDAAGDATGSIIIPNDFFLTGGADTTNPFAPTPAGTDASVHYSQSLGYSFVGGSDNYPQPVELGDATITIPPATSATPEPSSLVLLGTGVLSAAGMIRRRIKR